MTAYSAPLDSPTSLAPMSSYRGRFAPSPTGRLHLGSLLSGYGAYWRTRSQNGTFIVRLEDLDSTRCTLLNLLHIYQDLALFGLTSDEEIMVQSAHTSAYEQCLAQLLEQNHAYYCTCTRAELQTRPCPCAQPNEQANIRKQLTATATTKPTPLACAIRLDLTQILKQDTLQQFTDSHLGLIKQPQSIDPTTNENYTILPNIITLKRSDRFYAYNFAVVIDDHRQGINEVVRGADLLESTFLQLALYQLLGYNAPKFCHLPLLTDTLGKKLSKQNHAVAAVSAYTPYQATYYCWQYLQHTTATTDSSVITCVNSDQSITNLQAEFAHTEEKLSACIKPYQDDFDKIQKAYIDQYLADLSPAIRNTYHNNSEIFPRDSRRMQIYLINALLYCHLDHIKTTSALRLGWQRAANARSQALNTTSPTIQALINATSFDTLGSWLIENVLKDTHIVKISLLAELYYALLNELHRQFVARFDLQSMPQKSLVV